MHMLEITFPVQMTASLTIRVDPAAWRRMSRDEQRAIITAEAAVIQNKIDREGGFQCGTADLYGTIDGWNPEEMTEYDPNKEG